MCYFSVGQMRVLHFSSNIKPLSVHSEAKTYIQYFKRTTTKGIDIGHTFKTSLAAAYIKD